MVYGNNTLTKVVETLDCPTSNLNKVAKLSINLKNQARFIKVAEHCLGRSPSMLFTLHDSLVE